MGGGDEDDFQQRLRAIDEESAKAQHYLEQTTPRPPQHSTLHSAHWLETGAKLSVVEAGQPACGAKAIEYVEAVGPYSPSLLLRNPETCIRPRGHDGQHASEVVHHQFRKSLWKALVWD